MRRSMLLRQAAGKHRVRVESEYTEKASSAGSDKEGDGKVDR